MKYVEINDLPDKASKEAYDNGKLIESIQVLHSWLENQAQMLVMLVGSVHFDAKTKVTEEQADSFSFKECLKILFIMNQISKSEFLKFIEFDKIKKETINQIYKGNNSNDSKKVTRKKFDEVFKHSLENFYFFTGKSEIIIDGIPNNKAKRMRK